MELSVKVSVTADETPYQIIVSPYQLPPRPDGEHLLTVRAVDKAGWSTTASTRIYIDTTPPRTPENFRVIPGNGKIILKWDPSCPDTVE